jgi:signal transduction histidine kinase/ActR/RegA family two-component response regulator
VVNWLVGTLLVVVTGLTGYVARLRSSQRRLGGQSREADARLAAARAGAEAGAAGTARVLTWMRHEIRTPINAVLGMSDLLLDGDVPLKQREYLGMLRASAETLSRTFDDLFDLCRIDAGRVVLDSQPFNVREAVEVSLDQVAPMAAERALDLSCQIAPGTPVTVLGDVVRLRQVLTILLTNAFRRTHEGGVTVSVSASPAERGHELRFAVSDSGITIAAERVRGVFQPLSRIVASGDRVADAQDLGLALCHGLAQLMGGTLTLRSGESLGTTFELVIAAETPERVLEASRLRRSDAVDAARIPLRILLAEDSEVGRAVAVDMLQRLGHSVDVAADGLEVLEALNRHQYDVVLMDMQMPRMDGLATTRAVCERWPADRRPRIIAFGASELPEDRALWVEAGADAWVSKSLPSDELRRVLGISQRLDAGRRVPVRQTSFRPGAAPEAIAMFAREGRRLLLSLRDALERRDVASIERLAHTLKGSATMVGAASIASSCTELIHAVHEGAFDRGGGTLARIDLDMAEFHRTHVPSGAPEGASVVSAGPYE